MITMFPPDPQRLPDKHRKLLRDLLIEHFEEVLENPLANSRQTITALDLAEYVVDEGALRMATTLALEGYGVVEHLPDPAEKDRG